jgi:hypothetical protein
MLVSPVCSFIVYVFRPPLVLDGVTVHHHLYQVLSYNYILPLTFLPHLIHISPRR